jgi:hypothetical protein
VHAKTDCAWTTIMVTPPAASMKATAASHPIASSGARGSHCGFWNFSTKLSTGPVGCCVEKSRGSSALRYG